MRYGGGYQYRPTYHRPQNRGGYRGGYRGGNGYRTPPPSPYQIELRGAPANSSDTCYFKCYKEDGCFDFDLVAFRAVEQSIHVTDLQLELLMKDLNGQARPRNRFGCLLGWLAFLSGLLLTASFITILIVGILYLSSSSTPTSYSSSKTTFSSTRLYAKSRDVGQMVAEFIIGLITNIFTGMATLIFTLTVMQKHSTDMKARRKKYLQTACSFHLAHTFTACTTCTVQLTVATHGSYICMKITPKAVELL